MLPDPNFDCLDDEPTPFAQRVAASKPGDVIRFTLSEITQYATAGVLTDVLLMVRALVPAPPAIWQTRQARRAAMIALSLATPPALTCVECRLQRQPCYRIALNSFSTDTLNSNIRCSGCYLKGNRAIPCEVLVGNLDKEDRRESLFLTETDAFNKLLRANPICLGQFPAPYEDDDDDDNDDDGNAGYSNFKDLFTHILRQQDGDRLHHANSVPGSEQALRWACGVAGAVGCVEDLDREGDGAGGGPEDVHGVDLASLQHKAYHAMVRPNITYQLLRSKPHFLQPTPLTKANLEQIDEIRSKRGGGGPNSGVGASKKVQKRKATEDTSSDRETSDDQSSNDLQPFKKHAPAADERQPSKQHAASAASERALAFYKSRIADHFAPKFKSDADQRRQRSSFMAHSIR